MEHHSYILPTTHTHHRPPTCHTTATSRYNEPGHAKRHKARYNGLTSFSFSSCAVLSTGSLPVAAGAGAPLLPEGSSSASFSPPLFSSAPPCSRGSAWSVFWVLSLAGSLSSGPGESLVRALKRGPLCCAGVGGCAGEVGPSGGVGGEIVAGRGVGEVGAGGGVGVIVAGGGVGEIGAGGGVGEVGAGGGEGVIGPDEGEGVIGPDEGEGVIGPDEGEGVIGPDEGEGVIGAGGEVGADVTFSDAVAGTSELSFSERGEVKATASI